MQVTSQGACGKLWQCSLLLYYSGSIGDTVQKQRTAWILLDTGEPWCRVPVMALRDVRGQQPHGLPKFLHLSCSWFAGSQWHWGARNFRPSEAEILLQPKRVSSRSAAPLCFPTGAAQEGSLANWWVLHMCCCLWQAWRLCILTELAAMS